MSRCERQIATESRIHELRPVHELRPKLMNSFILHLCHTHSFRGGGVADNTNRCDTFRGGGVFGGFHGCDRRYRETLPYHYHINNTDHDTGHSDIAKREPVTSVITTFE